MWWGRYSVGVVAWCSVNSQTLSSGYWALRYEGWQWLLLKPHSALWDIRETGLSGPAFLTLFHFFLLSALHLTVLLPSQALKLNSSGKQMTWRRSVCLRDGGSCSLRASAWMLYSRVKRRDLGKRLQRHRNMEVEPAEIVQPSPA